MNVVQLIEMDVAIHQLARHRFSALVGNLVDNDLLPSQGRLKGGFIKSPISHHHFYLNSNIHVLFSEVRV